MEYQFTNDKPIYLQLMDVFKAGIISGELPEGSRLESVRDLAVAAKVNPNTMQKALSELERLGLIRTERTTGRFITDDKEKIAEMKKEIAEERDDFYEQYTNEDERPVAVMIDNFSANGFVINASDSQYVFSEKKAFFDMEILKSYLEENSITDITDIQFKVNVVNISDDDYGTICESDYIDVKF